jgi:hypothetical protein
MHGVDNEAPHDFEHMRLWELALKNEMKFFIPPHLITSASTSTLLRSS